MAAEIVTVTGTKKNGKKWDNRVLLWERSVDHPSRKNPDDEVGEAFIVNDGKDYTVALTSGVRRLLAEGLVKQVKLVEQAEPAPKKDK